MTKKLLYQFDTDTTASVFDSVVAYDGGADHVTGIGNVNPKNVLAMVDGCICAVLWPVDVHFCRLAAVQAK